MPRENRETLSEADVHELVELFHVAAAELGANYGPAWSAQLHYERKRWALAAFRRRHPRWARSNAPWEALRARLG